MVGESKEIWKVQQSETVDFCATQTPDLTETAGKLHFTSTQTEKYITITIQSQ